MFRHLIAAPNANAASGPSGAMQSIWFCAIVFAPSIRIDINPLTPSEPVPLTSIPTEFEPTGVAIEWKSTFVGLQSVMVRQISIEIEN